MRAGPRDIARDPAPLCQPATHLVTAGRSWSAAALRTAIVDSDPDATVSGGFDAIAVPIAVRDLVSLTVTATSADGEGVWTAQLQR